MPFYEYECQACKFYTEVMQKISDAPLTKCPSCGKKQLKKLVSAPVFRLKGGGWYETDFKGDKDKQRNLADRPEEAAKDSKDAKPKEDKATDGKDGKAAETKAAETPAAKETTAKEKPADKSAEKSSGAGARKATAGKSSPRGGRQKKKPAKIKRRG